MGKLGESTQQFDDATLALCAQKASGRENLRLQGWQVESVTGGSEQGHAIQRISGVGEADGHSLSWSLILKTVTGGPKNSADPQGSHYWKREPLYYQSGVLADLPGGLRAPRCYACLERPGGYQLFLEDLQGEVAGLSWPVEYYYSAARALGQFNGAYLAGKPIPAAEWIPRQWMRAYLEEAAPNMDLYSRFKDHPFVKKAFGVFLPV